MKIIENIKYYNVVGLSTGLFINIIIMSIVLNYSASLVVGTLCILPVYLSTYITVATILCFKINGKSLFGIKELVIHSLLLIFALSVIYVTKGRLDVLITIEGLISSIISLYYDMSLKRHCINNETDVIN